jgi:RNA polymerase sigma factor (sigma-70 family)
LEDFNVIYSLYHRQLLKYLFYLSKDYGLAEELLQETFYQAMKSVHRYRGDSKVSTWLYQIAKNTYSNYIKKNKKIQLDGDERFLDIADANTPEGILNQKQTKIEILKAIAELKEPYRDVVILRAVNELSFRQVGEILNQSENWAKVTFYRGKLKLQEILIERGVSYED